MKIGGPPERNVSTVVEWNSTTALRVPPPSLKPLKNGIVACVSIVAGNCCLQFAGPILS